MLEKEDWKQLQVLPCDNFDWKSDRKYIKQQAQMIIIIIIIILILIVKSNCNHFKNVDKALNIPLNPHDKNVSATWAETFVFCFLAVV